MLLTERLKIRPIRVFDGPHVVQYLDDAPTAKMLATVPSPYQLSDWKHFYDHFVLNDRQKIFAIAQRRGDKLIGMISYSDMGTDWEKGRLGYWMGTEHRRKGLMQEAVLAFLAYGFKQLNLKAIHAGHFDDNEPSAALQKQLGFTGDAKSNEHCLALGQDRPHTDRTMTNEQFQTRYPELWKKS